MVCIPCIIAPVLLYIWYRFIQPIVLKFWNPWAPKPAIKTSAEDTPNNSKNEKIASCPFSSKSEVAEGASEKDSGDKKID